MPPEQFKLDVANIFVQRPGRISQADPGRKVLEGKPAPSSAQDCLQARAAPLEPDEFNLWRGFGVEPRKGWQKQRRLLRHIREVICRRDKAKFKYLIRLLAWMVQNPGQAFWRYSCTQEPQAGYWQDHARQRDARHIWSAWGED